MRTSRKFLAGLVLTWAGGCLRPPLVNDATSGQIGSSESASEGVSTTGVMLTTAPDSATGSTDPPVTSSMTPAVCGDGVVEGDEECDDGNIDPHDACADTCTLTGLWAATYDNPGPNGAFWTGVAVTADGHVVVAGIERGDDFFDVDMVLAVYEPDGSLAWLQSIPGLPGASDQFNGVAIAPDGSILVCGSEYVAGDDLAFVLRAFSIAGTPLWTFSDAGGPDRPAWCGGLVVAAGSIFTAGTEWDDTLGINHATVRRHDVATGAVLWKQTHPGASSRAYGWAVAVGGGTVLVAGEDWIEEIAGARALLLAYDLDGGLLWTQPSDEDHTRWTAATAFGGDDFVIAGTVPDDGLLQSAHRIRRLDGDGNEIWTALFDDQDGGGLAVAPDQSILAVGSRFPDLTPEAIAFRLTADGRLSWSITDDGTADAGAQAWAVAVGQGVVAVAGGQHKPDMNDGDAWVRLLPLD